MLLDFPDLLEKGVRPATLQKEIEIWNARCDQKGGEWLENKVYLHEVMI